MTAFRVALFARTFVCLMMLWLLLSTAVLAADKLESVTLQLKWQHQFQFAGYYAAIEKGFYADAGFETQLIEYSGGSDLFEPVLNGTVDFGLADSSVVVKRLQDRPVVVLTTVFQHSPLVLISLKERGILSPYEFAGKKIMFQAGADDAAIQAMLTTIGVRPSEYELVAHNFDNFALLDSENPVDVMSAYLSNQPFLYEEKGIAVQVINPTNYGIDFYGDLLYTSERYVREHPERAVAFRDASLLGWQYALQHPEEVIAWLTEKYPSQKSTEALRYEAAVIKQMIAPNFVALGSMYPERFNRIAEIYKQLNLAPDNGDLDGFTLPEYLVEDSSSNRLLQIIGFIAIILGFAVGVLILVMRSLRNTVKRRTKELNQTNEALSHQLELTDRYVLSAVVNKDGKIKEASTALCVSSGYSQEELLHMSSQLLVVPDYLDRRQEAISKVLNGETWQGELQFLRKNGTTFWVFVYLDPMQGADGDIVGYRSTATDITEKKLIQQISETDGLTGIANRNKLDSALGKEWERYLRYGQEFSLILFDLDHFKKINDEFGHLEGDQVLIRVAKLVETLVRKIDTIGRWGGEDFLIIVPQTDRESAVLVAEKIRTAIAAMEDVVWQRITASFGVATAQPEMADSEVLLRLADKALYQAKENGRNQVFFNTK